MKIQSCLVILLTGLVCAQNAVAATIAVNSNADDTTMNDGHCTLREAILNANSDSDMTNGDCTAGSGTDTIRFSVGMGAFTIQPASALPDITAPIILDGTTQPGFAGVPLVEIDGTNAGMNVNGLTLSNHTGSTIKGLVINRFNAVGDFHHRQRKSHDHR